MVSDPRLLNPVEPDKDYVQRKGQLSTMLNLYDIRAVRIIMVDIHTDNLSSPFMGQVISFEGIPKEGSDLPVVGFQIERVVYSSEVSRSPEFVRAVMDFFKSESQGFFEGNVLSVDEFHNKFYQTTVYMPRFQNYSNIRVNSKDFRLNRSDAEENPQYRKLKQSKLSSS